MSWFKVTVTLDIQAKSKVVATGIAELIEKKFNDTLKEEAPNIKADCMITPARLDSVRHAAAPEGYS